MRFALFFLCLSACLAQNKDRTVVVVSIDGLPAYALDDPRIPMPTLRRLMREGATAARVRVSNPAVTWPSHTSMVTGVWPARHHVLYNGIFVRPGAHAFGKVEPWRPKTEMVRAPTVYDVAHQAGLTTAQVDWVAIYNAPTITWQFAEIPDAKGPIEREMIAAGTITEADLAGFSKGNIYWRDRIWTRAACHILRRHKPNLLLFHLLAMDSTHHRYGAGELATSAAMASADDRLREVLAVLDERTTVLVVSDHGFRNVLRKICGNAVLREHRLSEDVQIVPEGGTAMVYLRNPAQLAQVRQTLASVEGVAQVLGEADFAALGLPSSKQTPQSPELILVAREGYAFTGGSEGPAVFDAPLSGSHGYLNTDPRMDAILVAWGRGIRPGARVETAESIDLAPTIATLLGVRMPAIDGKPLTGILMR